MELNKIISSFDLYQGIILDTLEAKNVQVNDDHQNLLTFIGKSYLRFKESNSKEVSIKIPIYNFGLHKYVLDYLVSLDLLVKILQSPRVTNFEGTSIFDVFSEPTSQKNYLEFVKSERNTLFFQETIISNDRFFPVFKTNQIDQKEFDIAIDEAFFLFSKIARSGIVKHPVLINLNSNLNLCISKSKILEQEKLLTINVVQNEIESDEDLDKVLDELNKLDIDTIFSIKYPYHTNIDSRILAEFKEVAQFEICLRPRFSFSEIEENDIFILPGEIDGVRDFVLTDIVKHYEVIQTDHDQTLYNSISDLRLAWASLELSPFRYPFPGKWLMCIHQGETIDFWKNQYRKDFPAIRGIMLQNIENIIESIFSINWTSRISNSSKDHVAVVKTSQMFPTVFDSFNNYVSDKFKRLFNSEDQLLIEDVKEHTIVILDSLNKILLSNISHLPRISEIKILIPDFIYFSSPFIKYRVVSYQYEALLEGGRAWFDPSYQHNLHVWEEQKKVLLSEIKNAKQKYDKTYSKKLPDNNEPDSREYQNLEVVDYSESEIVELLLKKENEFASQKHPQSILIKTSGGTVFNLRPQTAVLLDANGFIVQTKASLINVGSHFLPVSEIAKNIDQFSLLDKLTSIPTNALNWKNKLLEKRKSLPQLYRLLHKAGLSVQENTFNKDYLSDQQVLNSNDVHLPRSKKDWGIVCGFLNIQEENEAWRCHKCREDINSLKRAYKEIVNFLIQNELFGKTLNDQSLSQIMDIFESVTGIVEDEDRLDKLKTATSITKDITKKLILQEASFIQTPTYE